MKKLKKIYIGSDHAGYGQKENLKSFLNQLDYEVIDFGTHGFASVDYPDFAKLVAQAVQSDPNSYGVLLCGSGVGVCVSANKFKGIRAALVDRVELASYAVTHDNCNVICLSSRFTSFNDNCKILKDFLSATFEAGRHVARINKISELED